MIKENVTIVSALRTPIGKLLGSLSSLSAPELASKVIARLIRGSGISAGAVDEVIMGNVVTAGVGQNPARQASILGGLPNNVNSFTVNKVCASGMKAVALGVQSIMCEGADCIIAGGMESMSNAPHLISDLRRGKRYGQVDIKDSMILDGLWDKYYNAHMGTLCEDTVKRYNISRYEQDKFSLNSHKKAADAMREGRFISEVVPVKLYQKGEENIINTDESVRMNASIKQLSALPTVFKNKGTITAGNAPGLNDGAAALLLMSKKKAERLGITPVAEIIHCTASHVNPKWYPVAPVKSVRRLLKVTGLSIDDFDLIELNEAFAAQALAVIKELNMDIKKVNINGGAIALGHPIGASGARIVVTLIHALRALEKKLGLASLCLGGGGAMSMAVQLL